MNTLQISVLITTAIMFASFGMAIRRQDRFGDWLLSCVFVPSTVTLVVLLLLGLFA